MIVSGWRSWIPDRASTELVNARAARLAAHGAAPDAEEGGARIETLAGEVGHYRAGPLLPAPLKPSGHIASHVVARAVVANAHFAEPAGQLQLPPGHQPVGDLVVSGVLHQYLVRHGADHPFERIQIGGARDFRPVGPPEHEVAEMEPVAHQAPDPAKEVPRALQQKVGADLPGERFVFRTPGVQDRRDVRAHPPHGGDEPFPGLRVRTALAGEFDVRDHPEDLVREGREGIPRLLVMVTEQDLRPAANPVEFLREAQPFGDEFLGLFEDRLVHHRKERGVVADAVLDQQDGGNSEFARVLGCVPAVLDLLHDRQEDPDVTLPDEGFFEVAAMVARQVLAHRAGVVPEERDRRLPSGVAEPMRERPDVHVTEIRRADHQLETVRRPGEAIEGLGPRLDLRHARQGPQVQIEEPGKNPVVELAVLGEDERVVVTQHEENFADLEADKIGERRRKGAVERHAIPSVSLSDGPPAGA